MGMQPWVWIVCGNVIVYKLGQRYERTGTSWRSPVLLL